MKKAVILFLAVLFFTGNAYAETDCIPSSVSNEGIILALDEIGVVPSATQEENEPEIIPPFIPEGMQKTNFGTDDRITVSGDQLFAFPFSCIAMLEMEFDCGTYNGTGFMISPNRMLTAAHCLYCEDHGTPAKKVTFYFGYKNRRDYLLKYDGPWYGAVGTTFSKLRYETKNDYACILFPTEIGNRTGYLGSWWNIKDSDIPYTSCYLAGYRDGILKYTYGYPDDYDSDFIYHRLDMLPGNSGGPLFTSDNYAIGINIADNTNYNIEFRLNNKVKNQFDNMSKGGSWKQDSKGWWYEFPKGMFLKDCWFSVDGVWYHFDKNGYMQTNQWVGAYYVTSSGAMAVNTWIGQYYVGADGRQQKVRVKQGTWKNDGRWWYQYTDGTYPTNAWVWIGDGTAKCYRFDAKGYLYTSTTVDGSTVNGNGEWTVNGVPQTMSSVPW